VDVSGEGNDGVFKGGEVNRVKGKFGNALEFVGTGFVEIPDSESLSLTDAITITSWVQVNSSFTNQGFISKCNYGANQRSYLVRIDNDKFSFGFTQQLDGGWVWVAENEVLEQEQWYHVAATHDGANIKIYVDGKFVNETAANFKIPDATTPLMFGVHGIAPDTKFIGVLDDIGIFSTDLSEDKITEIMANGLERVSGLEPSGKLASTWGTLKSEH